MVEKARLLAVDDVALRQEATQVAEVARGHKAARSAKAAQINGEDQLSPAAERFARQQAEMLLPFAEAAQNSLFLSAGLWAEELKRQQDEMWRSMREATEIRLISPASALTEEIDRLRAEMLHPLSLFDSQMREAMADLSFKGSMPDLMAGLGLGVDLSWKSIIGDTVDALRLPIPFPLPERRPAPRPAPKSDPVPKGLPPAVPQIDNATLLQTFFNRLRTGELTVDELRAATQPGRTGPKDSDSEWPVEKIMLMWAGWQACKHKWTAARYLKELQWGIQESRMYKLFRAIGLSSKQDTN